uniref:Uncharacterized protein n=1 Tax=Anguilla anguilla TaxID=7936 RepID=A0A0E9QGR9_ANGAN
MNRDIFADRQIICKCIIYFCILSTYATTGGSKQNYTVTKPLIEVLRNCLITT